MKLAFCKTKYQLLTLYSFAALNLDSEITTKGDFWSVGALFF